MDFYDRVKQLAKSKNLSLIPFLESIGVDYDKYKGQRRYGNLPRADVAVRIAEALDTSVEYLVTGRCRNPSNTELEALRARVRDFLSDLL